MTIGSAAASLLALAWGWVTLAWAVGVARRDAGVMDVLWGPGFLLLAAAAYAAGGGGGGRRLLLLALVAAWGLRLAWHIGRRSRGRPEDFRYRAWRERAGDAFWWRSYFRVFLLQGAVMAAVAAPILWVQLAPGGGAPLGLRDLAGLGVWGAGLAIESAADARLARFRSDPANRGRLLRDGMWAWTRHPNYFGEALVWWGFWLLATPVPGGAWTMFSPLLMTWLLRRVSGVPLLEAALRGRPGWEEYAAATPAFFPRPPSWRGLAPGGSAARRVLFVCVENSCRSQMAEGWLRALSPERFEAHSAGSRPSGEVDPRAVRLMAEIGIDLAGQRSKGVETAGGRFDAVVSMGCGDACPHVPAARRIEWELPDPKALPDDEFRRIRDRIGERVRDLVRELDGSG